MFRVAQDKGRGLLMQGTMQWQNISIQSTITPYMAEQFGLAVRVQGLNRYYALLLDTKGEIKLVRVFDTQTILAKTEIDWDGTSPLPIRLQIAENELQGWVDDKCVIKAVDSENMLTSGGIALVIEEGCVITNAIQVQPAEKDSK